jgi:4-hydroxythreonine-4-phosphate dehydrogenase
MTRKPFIAITMGDPAGIGPEIIAKNFADGKLFTVCRPVVVGNTRVMRKIIKDLGMNLSVKSIPSLRSAAPAKGHLDVLNTENVDMARHRWGKPSVASGRAVVDYIKQATALALKGEVAAIVTAPINKEMMNAAGASFGGHTELLAYLTGTKEYGMLFVGGGMNMILVTIHHALKDVPRLIRKHRVLRTLRLARKAMRELGVDEPRIGVAALNPHASEGGLFGNEELDEILPAVLEARNEGMDVSDPIPADTLFHRARKGDFNIVVAMYHDQGLGPLKMQSFGRLVNVTIGLPIIRTSVDHGTAYDIAGQGAADPSSLREAVNVAVLMAANRSKRKEGPQ